MSEQNEHDVPGSQAIRMARLIYKTTEKELLTTTEQQALDAWLTASDANRQLYASLNDRSHTVHELEALLRYDANKAVVSIFKALSSEPPANTGKRRSMIIRTLSVAASLVVLAGAGWWFFARPKTSAVPSMAVVKPGAWKAQLIRAGGQALWLDSTAAIALGPEGSADVWQEGGRILYKAVTTHNRALVYNTLIAPRGCQYKLQLSDGSEVWLNAGSSITYPTSFTGLPTREVTITGEGWFTVAKDTTHPFLVTARDMKVEVTGTTFNVMAYEDEEVIRTTLIEGGVKARNVHHAEQPELLLLPGQQAVLQPQTGVLRREKPDLDEVSSWRFGQLRFNETSMPAIMRQIARWYGVHIEYAGAVDEITFTGPLTRTDHVQELLDILSATRQVHFSMKGDTSIVVLPGPSQQR